MPSVFGKSLPWENKLKSRIVKGIDYFWNLKPSSFDAGQKLLLTEFLKLLKEYLGKTDGDKLDDDKLYEAGKQIFGK